KPRGHFHMSPGVRSGCRLTLPTTAWEVDASEHRPRVRYSSDFEMGYGQSHRHSGVIAESEMSRAEKSRGKRMEAKTSLRDIPCISKDSRTRPRGITAAFGNSPVVAARE